MLTTIDDSTNGFRLEIMPMAMTSTDSAAKSLLHAILALASFHLGSREEALTHKVRAIKALSDSFKAGTASSGGEENLPTQFASCLMLCVYSVSGIRHFSSGRMQTGWPTATDRETDLYSIPLQHAY